MSNVIVPITTVFFVLFMSIMENNAKENRVCNIITQVIYYIIVFITLVIVAFLLYVAALVTEGRWLLIVVSIVGLCSAGINIYTAIDLARNMPLKISPRREREEMFINMDGYSRTWNGYHPAEGLKADKK